jgi:Immunoglobulin-like domain of bacterial spore germination
MKKMFLLLTILLVLGVTACSPKEETQDKNESTNVTENEGENPKEAENPNPFENESTTDNEHSTSTGKEMEDNESEAPTIESPEPTTYENNSFKDVAFNENENGIIVTGKARVFEGVFQYSVVSGGEILKEDHYQTDGAPAWGAFELSIEKDLLTKPGTSLELFVYSAKDGSKTDVLPIILVKE